MDETTVCVCESVSVLSDAVAEIAAALENLVCEPGTPRTVVQHRYRCSDNIL